MRLHDRTFSCLSLLLAFAACLSLAVRPAGAWDKTCRTQSQTHLALVIGNSYAGVWDVTGKKDAAVMADHLCQLGFSLPPPLLEADLAGMTAAIEQFRADIEQGHDVVETIFFFFSGHGYQIGDRNFLLPVDKDIDTQNPQLPLEAVFWALNAARKEANKLVFLDACRTSAGLRVEASGTLGQVPDWEDGLSEPAEPPSKTLFSFAAGYDTAMPSGEKGDHSPYSKALLDSIREPGLELRDLLRRVDSDLGGKQVPASQGGRLIDSPFYFKKPIPIGLEVKDARDELVIIHNGEVAYAVQGTHREKLLLNGGDNHIALFVSNGRTYKSSQTWRVPDGWGYHVTIDWPYTPRRFQCDSFEPEDCFKGGEPIPYKDGPHHGRVFQVAKANILVDPDNWEIEVTAAPRLWENVEVKARSQKPLWESSLNDLGLEERAELRNYLNLISIFKVILEVLNLKDQVQLPDTSQIYAQIHGNEAFTPWADYCMTDPRQRQQRLKELETSIKSALGNKEIKPFDSFDEALSDCIWKQVSQQAGNTFKAKDVVVYTAIEEYLPDAPR